jgi:PAS domain S-box-containing protein
MTGNHPLRRALADDPSSSAEVRLRELERLAHIGSWDWDLGADHLSWSAEMYRITGLAPGSPVSFERYASLYHPDDAERVLSEYRAARDAAEPYATEYRIIRPDGAERWVIGRAAFERNEAGAVVRVFGTVQDVTERKLAELRAIELLHEQRLRSAAEQAEERMSFLAEASRVLASSLDFETTLRNVAKLAVPTIADWAAVDLVGDDGQLLRLAVEHTDPMKRELAVAVQRRYPPAAEAEHGAAAVVRTGESQYMREIPDELLIAGAVDDEHLALLRSLGLRSFIVAPLAAREGVLGAITFVHAESGRHYDADDLPYFEDLARRAAVAIENARLVRDLEKAKARLEEQAALLEARGEELEQQAAQMEEFQIELELSNAELHESNAQLSEKTATLERQAAENRRLLETVQHARAAAEQANRAKGDFLATMSHELRTPLNAMIGYADLLLAGIPEQLGEAARHNVSRIAFSARHLLELIEEVLTFSRLEAGEEIVRAAPLDVATVIAEVETLSAPLAGTKALGFRIDVADDMPPMHSDARKIRQIVLNLVGNAIKFTSEGGVELRVEPRGDSAVFVIADTGIGIDAGDREKVFEPFWQADTGTTRAVGGTGLGLTVARRLARLLGGDVVIADSGEQGSTFVLTLPLRAPAGTAG